MTFAITRCFSKTTSKSSRACSDRSANTVKVSPATTSLLAASLESRQSIRATTFPPCVDHVPPCRHLFAGEHLPFFQKTQPVLGRIKIHVLRLRRNRAYGCGK